MRCKMDGSVVPDLTDCPVISMTRVERKCLRWSADRVRAEGTATAADKQGAEISSWQALHKWIGVSMPAAYRSVHST